MSDMPDWLRELAVDRDQDDLEAELPSLELRPEAEEPAPDAFVGELRDQFDAGPAVELADATRRPRTLAGMRPWQVFVLTLLLFLNIAVIGCLFLTVLGRFSF